MTQLDYIRIVLVEPTHPGNIGAVARAMGNFGLSRLVLVNPLKFPHPDADARAAASVHLLEQAKVVPTLPTALADCGLVIGSSARARRIGWPELAPAAAATRLLAVDPQPAALVFGRESSGLTNDELAHCHACVRIPSEPDNASLNLAMAASILFYALREQRPPEREEKPQPLLATHTQTEHFYRHLWQVLIRTGFSAEERPRLHRKLVRLFSRTELYGQEVRTLRGMLRAIERALDKESAD